MIPLRGWWRNVRGHALIAATRGVVHRYLYRSHEFVITRSDLAGPPVPDHVGGVVFRLATRSDLDRLDDLEPYGRGSRQRRYVDEDKDWLFVASHADRIVATRRTCRALPRASRDGHGLIPRLLQLEPGHLWAGDLFCLPEYRNQGIGRHLELFGDRFLASLGYTTVFGNIALSNTAAARLHFQIGKKPVLYVSISRVLFYKHVTVSKEPPGGFPRSERAASGVLGRRPEAESVGRPAPAL